MKEHIKKLVVVLYHSEGYAFPQKTLEKAQLKATEVARETAPDHPWAGEVVVLWVDDKNSLQVSNAKGEVESELLQLITQQPWAQYLEQHAPASASNGRHNGGGSQRQLEQSSLPSASASRQGPSLAQEVNTHSATLTLPSIPSSHGALGQNTSYGVSNGNGNVIKDLECTSRPSRWNSRESGSGSERRREIWKSDDLHVSR